MGGRRPPLTVAQILAWADAHFARTGAWPTAASGAVRGAGGEHWRALDTALRRGSRGLPGGDSLARLLDRERRPGARGWRTWTAAEDALVRALPPAEAARRTGRTAGAVYQRRWVLGLTLRRGGEGERGRGGPHATTAPCGGEPAASRLQGLGKGGPAGVGAAGGARAGRHLQTVTVGRKAPGVDASTEEMTRLRQGHGRGPAGVGAPARARRL